MTKRTPFRYFRTSPDVVRLTVMMCVRCPLSLRNVEDLVHERGIEISPETVWFGWNRFGPIFAAEVRRKRVERMRSLPHWRWHLDEVFVKINGGYRTRAALGELHRIAQHRFNPEGWTWLPILRGHMTTDTCRFSFPTPRLPIP